MNADYKVLLDSCVLANYAVCNLILRLAEKPRMLLPKWTEDILEEVHRTHTEKLDWDKDLADSFQVAVKKAFPEAMITGYQPLISAMTNHEKDRHVLAAAVREKLDIIITFNLRDFKKEHLEKWGISAIHPQDYLITLYEMNPAGVLNRLTDISLKQQQDMESTLIDLGRSLPVFASFVLDQIR